METIDVWNVLGCQGHFYSCLSMAKSFQEHDATFPPHWPCCISASEILCQSVDWQHWHPWWHTKIQILWDHTTSTEVEILGVGLSDLCWSKSPGEPGTFKGKSEISRAMQLSSTLPWLLLGGVFIWWWGSWWNTWPEILKTLIKYYLIKKAIGHWHRINPWTVSNTASHSS